jgi:hypothetical protein
VSDFAPTRNTYSSTSPVWARDLLKAETHGRQLNGDLFPAGTFPDGVVPSGTVLGIVTATGLAGPYDDAALDGRQTAVGHLVNETRVKAGGRDLQAVLHAGTVTRRLLPANSGMNDAAAADLSAIVYI